MYKAILFAIDGDYITDFHKKTKTEVENSIADMGSRWYFYPIVAIIKDNNSNVKNNRLIIENSGIFNLFNGKSVKTFIDWIKNNQDIILSELS
jgi:hypothetical protein